MAVMLVRLHRRHGELRTHQPDVVTEGLELAAPRVRSAPHRHTDQTGRPLGHDALDLRARESLVDDDLAAGFNPMHLTDVLCDVDANCDHAQAGPSVIWSVMQLARTSSWPCHGQNGRGWVHSITSDVECGITLISATKSFLKLSALTLLKLCMGFMAAATT